MGNNKEDETKQEKEVSSGQCDLPVKQAKEDLLNVRSYIDALSDFVMTCKTPMTISIQGEWGSGKTSFINMMREKLKEEKEKDKVLVLPEVFNTWQYSQFELGDQLPIVLIGKLIKACGGDNKDTLDKVKAIVRNTMSVIGGVVDNAAKIGKLQLPVSDILLAICEEKNDAVKVIDNLKKLFQECINEGIENERKKRNLSKESEGRFIVFIDDLDRLEPKKAVELLEVLKVFMDCQNVVFILAIDYEVVVRGVADKYGTDFERGRQFFDKIIQLPYKMPIAQYKLNKLLNKCFCDMNLVTTECFEKNCEKMTTYSVGYNPRAIKRLLNAFQLLRLVKVKMNADEKKDKDDLDQLFYLFSILCLQLKYENVYFNLVKAIPEMDSGEIELLLENLRHAGHVDDEDYEGRESDYYDSVVKGISSNMLEGISEWFCAFYNITKENLDYKKLKEATCLSYTTSGPETVTQEKQYEEFVTASLSEIVEKGNYRLNGAQYSSVKFVEDLEETSVGGIKDTVKKLLERMLKENETGFADAREALKDRLISFYEGARKDDAGNRILKSPFTIGSYQFCGDFTADKLLKYVYMIGKEMNSKEIYAVISFKPVKKDTE